MATKSSSSAKMAHGTSTSPSSVPPAPPTLLAPPSPPTLHKRRRHVPTTPHSCGPLASALMRTRSSTPRAPSRACPLIASRPRRKRPSTHANTVVSRRRATHPATPRRRATSPPSRAKRSSAMALASTMLRRPSTVQSTSSTPSTSTPPSATSPRARPTPSTTGSSSCAW